MLFEPFRQFGIADLCPLNLRPAGTGVLDVPIPAPSLRPCSFSQNRRMSSDAILRAGRSVSLVARQHDVAPHAADVPERDPLRCLKLCEGGVRRPRLTSFFRLSCKTSIEPESCRNSDAVVERLGYILPFD